MHRKQPLLALSNALSLSLSCEVVVSASAGDQDGAPAGLVAVPRAGRKGERLCRAEEAWLKQD